MLVIRCTLQQNSCVITNAAQLFGSNWAGHDILMSCSLHLIEPRHVFNFAHHLTAQIATLPMGSHRIGCAANMSSRGPQMLHEFLTGYRDDIVARVAHRARGRVSLRVSDQEIEHGIPMFLTQLAETLRLEGTP